MKFVMFTLFTLLMFSASSFAQQTDDCGANMRQVSDIINSKFNGVFPVGYTNRFIGNWESGSLSFSISASQTFTVKGAPYLICPQQDGSFFIFSKEVSGRSGYIRYAGRGKAKFYGGAGAFWFANGTYEKANSRAFAKGQKRKKNRE